MLKSAGALVFLIAVPAAAQAPRIAVDPRVELFSVIFRLAGNSEYNRRTTTSSPSTLRAAARSRAPTVCRWRRSR